MRRPVSLAALVAFGAFVVGNLVLGERFPFSRYDMYATSGARTVGAVPFFLADGRPVDVRELEAFAGVDPEALLPPGTPSSMNYVVDEAARWIASHRAPEATAATPGRVSFEVGYRYLRVEEGRLVEQSRTVARGTARRR